MPNRRDNTVLVGCFDVIKDKRLLINRWRNTLDHLPQVATQNAVQVEQFRYLFMDACRIRMRKLIFDTGKPDGTPRKLLNLSKLEAAGWTYKTDLRDGIEKAY